MSAGDPAKLDRIVAEARRAADERGSRRSTYAPFANRKELLAKKQTPK
jgi:hypothetical protein